MLRKYGFALLALAVAVVSLAFTAPKKPTVDMFVFQFDGTVSGGYSVANVQNISNTYWKYIGKNVALCNNTNEKACRVQVTGTYVNNITTPTALKDVTITAALDGSIAYVNTISGTGSQRSNQNQ